MAYSGAYTDLLEAEIKDVKSALANLTEAGAVDPVVKATIRVSESGFVGVQEVIAYGELKREGFAGTFYFLVKLVI